MMKKMLVLAALVTAGCGEFPLYLNRDEGPAIQTETTGYVMSRTNVGYTVEVPFTFTNTTGRTIYLVHCRPGAGPGGASRVALAMTLERQQEGGWKPAWGSVVPQCLSPAIALQRGETYTDTLQVFAGHHGSNYYPQFDRSEIEGTYRITWRSWYYSWDPATYDWSNPVEREFTTSNRFHLKASGD